MDKVKINLTTEIVSDFNELFQRVSDIDVHTQYSSDANAKLLLRDTMNQFVSEVNEAIKEGKVPP